MSTVMQEGSTTPPSVEIHHGPGFSWAQPIPDPEAAASAAAARGADVEGLLAAVRQAQGLAHELHRRAQYGLCDRHQGPDGEPILVLRTVRDRHCPSCHRVESSAVVCPVCTP